MAHLSTVAQSRTNKRRLAGGVSGGATPPPQDFRRLALQRIAAKFREQAADSLRFAESFEIIALQGTDGQVEKVLTLYEETERMENGLSEKEPDVSQTN